MRSRIFISYRVEDTEHAVGRLAEDLRERFGRDQVFHDIASIAPGTDFVDALHQALAVSAATLVVIGPRWLVVTNKNGERRIDRPDDWVVQEVASSLRDKEVRVFPVLVGGAHMPAAEQLPEPLRLLLRRQAFHLTSRHWPQDVDVLVQHLCGVPGIAIATHSASPHKFTSAAMRVRGQRVWILGIVVAVAAGIAFLLGPDLSALKRSRPEVQPRPSAAATDLAGGAASDAEWSVTPSSNFVDTAREYRRMFLATSRDPFSMARVTIFANQVLASRSRYESVVSGTRMPWYMVGILHGLEAGFAFDRHLHNGDPLSARTIQAPAGRPVAGRPPFTWEASARDALARCRWADEQDWSFPHILYLAEAFNGFGYRKRGLPSPYVWAATDIYSKGRYRTDGSFDSNLKAQNVGVAAVLKELVARGVIEL